MSQSPLQQVLGGHVTDGAVVDVNQRKAQVGDQSEDIDYGMPVAASSCAMRRD